MSLEVEGTNEQFKHNSEPMCDMLHSEEQYCEDNKDKQNLTIISNDPDEDDYFIIQEINDVDMLDAETPNQVSENTKNKKDEIMNTSDLNGSFNDNSENNNTANDNNMIVSDLNGLLNKDPENSNIMNDESMNILGLNGSLNNDPPFIGSSDNDENHFLKSENKDDSNHSSESEDCEITLVIPQRKAKKSASIISSILNKADSINKEKENNGTHNDSITNKSLAPLSSFPPQSSLLDNSSPLITTMPHNHQPTTTIIIKPTTLGNNSPKFISSLLSNAEKSKPDFVNSKTLFQPVISSSLLHNLNPYLKSTSTNFQLNAYGNLTLSCYPPIKPTNNVITSPQNFMLPDKSILSKNLLDLKAQNEKIIKSFNAVNNISDDNKKILLSTQNINQLRPVATVAFNLGLDLVRSHAYQDQLNYFINTKKGKEGILNTYLEGKINQMKESCQKLKENLIPFNIPLLKCRCNFITYLNSSLQLHKRTGHLFNDDSYGCCICMKYATKMNSKLMEHLYNVHKMHGKASISLSTYLCYYCNLETRDKRKFQSHIKNCQKSFNLNKNLATSLEPFEISLIKLIPLQKISKFSSQNLNVLNSQNLLNKASLSCFPVRLPTVTSNVGQLNPISFIKLSNNQMNCLPIHFQNMLKSNNYNVQCNNNSTVSNSGKTVLPNNIPLVSKNNVINSSSNKSVKCATNTKHSNLINLKQKLVNKVVHVSRFNAEQEKLNISNKDGENLTNFQIDAKKKLSSILLNKDKQVKPVKNIQGPVCEVCYEKLDNLQHLQIHMNLIHRVTIFNINYFLKGKTFVCKNCFESFWTLLGLEKHEHLAHKVGLKFCRLCDDPKPNILSHLSSSHNATLQDMFLSKICYLCTKIIDTFDDFHVHMCTLHKDLFPSLSFLEEIVPIGSLKSDTPIKISPKKCNKKQKLDSVVISPAKHHKFRCTPCNWKGSTKEEFEAHINVKHTVSCTRCNEKFPSRIWASNHFTNVHSTAKDSCQLCAEKVRIGIPMIRHIKRAHLKKCSVLLTRLSSGYKKKYLQNIKTTNLEKEKSPNIVVVNLTQDSKDSLDDSGDVVECL